jgi:hypothetical protein
MNRVEDGEIGFADGSKVKVTAWPTINFKKRKLTKLDATLELKKPLDNDVELYLRVNGDLVKIFNGKEDVNVKVSFTKRF